MSLCIAKIQIRDPHAHQQVCACHIMEKTNFFICDKMIGRLLVTELSFSSERGLMSFAHKESYEPMS